LILFFTKEVWASLTNCFLSRYWKWIYFFFTFLSGKFCNRPKCNSVYK
jgi:hypothetical protein